MNEHSSDLSVVLPAYKEAANLANLLPRLKTSLEKLNCTWEVIVVDARERIDETPEVCARNGVTHLQRTGGDFYGHAVRSGIAASGGRHVVFMDADGSHGPEFVAQLWPFRDKADMVIASRYVKGGRTENPWLLIWMSRCVNWTFRLFLRLKCADVSNSYRLYRGDELRRTHLECDHFDIVEEMLVKLYFSRPDYVIREVPFTFEKRKEGQTKRKLFSFAIGYAATLHRLRKLKSKMRKADAKQS